MTAMHELTDPDAATAVALLRASINGDVAGQHAIVVSCDPYALLATVAGLAIALGVKAVSADAPTDPLRGLDELLSAWQAEELRAAV